MSRTTGTVRAMPVQRPETGVFGYSETTGDIQFFWSRSLWTQQLTNAGIQRYLREHLREQLVREVPVALTAYKNASSLSGIGTGFWALTRMVLTPITFLGTLYRGSDSTRHTVDFMEEFLGRRQNKQRYLDVSCLIVEMFRHGLVHTAMPKSLHRKRDGQVVGWAVSLERTGHLEYHQGSIVICPEPLFEDLLVAIDHFIADFTDPTHSKTRREAFISGYLTMGEVCLTEEIRSPAMRRSVIAALDRL